MTLDYNAARLDFFETAPDLPGFKPEHVALYSALVYLLEQAGTRSVNINYDRVNGLTKLSEETYSRALKWLDESKLIQYVAGKNRYAQALIYVQVPEKVEPEKAGSIGGSTWVSTGGSIQGSTGGSSQALPDSGSNPPPHPPIEENIIISLGLDRPGEGVEQIFKKPNGIELTDEEEVMLLQAHGSTRLTLMLMKVAELKRRHGGKLVTSDYNNVVKWAAGQVLQDEKEAATRRIARPGPMVTSTTAPGTKANKPFRELT